MVAFYKGVLKKKKVKFLASKLKFYSAIKANFISHRRLIEPKFDQLARIRKDPVLNKRFRKTFKKTYSRMLLAIRRESGWYSKLSYYAKPIRSRSNFISKKTGLSKVSVEKLAKKWSKTLLTLKLIYFNSNYPCSGLSPKKRLGAYQPRSFSKPNVNVPTDVPNLTFEIKKRRLSNIFITNRFCYVIGHLIFKRRPQTITFFIPTENKVKKTFSYAIFSKAFLAFPSLIWTSVRHKLRKKAFFSFARRFSQGLLMNRSFYSDRKLTNIFFARLLENARSSTEIRIHKRYRYADFFDPDELFNSSRHNILCFFLNFMAFVRANFCCFSYMVFGAFSGRAYALLAVFFKAIVATWAFKSEFFASVWLFSEFFSRFLNSGSKGLFVSQNSWIYHHLKKYAKILVNEALLGFGKLDLTSLGPDFSGRSNNRLSSSPLVQINADQKKDKLINPSTSSTEFAKSDAFFKSVYVKKKLIWNQLFLYKNANNLVVNTPLLERSSLIGGIANNKSAISINASIDNDPGFTYKHHSYSLEMVFVQIYEVFSYVSIIRQCYMNMLGINSVFSNFKKKLVKYFQFFFISKYIFCFKKNLKYFDKFSCLNVFKAKFDHTILQSYLTLLQANARFWHFYFKQFLKTHMHSIWKVFFFFLKGKKINLLHSIFLLFSGRWRFPKSVFEFVSLNFKFFISSTGRFVSKSSYMKKLAANDTDKFASELFSRLRPDWVARRFAKVRREERYFFKYSSTRSHILNKGRSNFDKVYLQKFKLFKYMWKKLLTRFYDVCFVYNELFSLNSPRFDIFCFYFLSIRLSRRFNRIWRRRFRFSTALKGKLSKSYYLLPNYFCQYKDISFTIKAATILSNLLNDRYFVKISLPKNSFYFLMSGLYKHF